MEMEQLQLDLDTDFLVVQDNSMIMANYSMTALEQKVFLILLSTIKKDDSNIKKTSFRIIDLAEIMGISTQVLYRDLKKACKSIMSKLIEIQKPDGDWHIFNLIPSAKYNNKQGTITLKINEEAYPYLLELKELFTSFRLENALTLDSKYAIRIFQQAKSNIYKRTYIIELENFKKQLGITQKSYQQFSNINLKILTPSVKEINEKTDINLNIETIKVGNKVHSLKFNVSTKNDKQKVIFKSSGKQAKSNTSNNFNNFDARDIYSNPHQMKLLEHKLLGWDNEDNNK
jgi:plasmid replication initiation protein